MSLTKTVRHLMLSLLLTAPASAGSLPDVSAREPTWERYGGSDAGESGYVMYTRKPAGSDYSAYRLEAVLAAPTELVAAVAAKHIADPNNRQKNVDKTILRNDDEAILIHNYIHINAPFVSDRDVITRIERAYDSESGAHQVSWHATDEGPPPKRGVIRLDRSEGSWTFVPAEDSGTHAIYLSHTEIAGSLPAWLLNSFMSDSMVQAIEGLQEAVARELDGP
ncbi:MAG: hypothetical protein GY944_29815 [bacterium]|nr:hypothetical protein [bacterium]